MMETAYRILSEVYRRHEKTEKEILRHRRKVYKIWICASCNKKYFYLVARCPMCDSNKIEEYINQVSHTSLNKTAFEGAVKKR